MRGQNRRIVRRRPRRQRRSGLFWGAVAAVAVVVVVLTVVNSLGGGGGEVSGTPSDPEQVGSVTATATRLDLGEVSLGHWVSPTFRLRNTSAEQVAVTIPSSGVETLEGC